MMSLLSLLQREPSSSVPEAAEIRKVKEKILAFKEPLTAETILKPKEIPNILLIDDDPTFGKIMERIASKLDVPFTYYKSINELTDVSSWNFDVAIVDYDLGAVNGFELTAYMEDFTSDLPVVLVSQNKNLTSRKWPVSVRDFVHKGLGPYAIFDAVFEAHQIGKLYEQIKRKKKFSH
jgi:CheY-like chemotaxis protein